MPGACVLAGLMLVDSGVNDVSTLDCELYRLTELIANDVSEWDNLATACLGPGSLLTAETCPRIPKLHISGKPVYPLYNEASANEYFTKIVSLQTCSWFFSDDVACKDISALRTLGSERRNQFLDIHRLRADAAIAVREQRLVSLAVLENTIKSVCTNIECGAVRALYTIEGQASRPADSVPPVLSASSRVEL